MKYLFTLIASLVLALALSAPAQAQTSNILIVSQDSATKVITVTKASDKPLPLRHEAQTP